MLFHYKLTDMDNLKAAKWIAVKHSIAEETQILTTRKKQAKVDVQFAEISG